MTIETEVVRARESGPSSIHRSVGNYRIARSSVAMKKNAMLMGWLTIDAVIPAEAGIQYPPKMPWLLDCRVKPDNDTGGRVTRGIELR
jgi:hypothetical protein